MREGREIPVIQRFPGRACVPAGAEPDACHGGTLPPSPSAATPPTAMAKQRPSHRLRPRALLCGKRVFTNVFCEFQHRESEDISSRVHKYASQARDGANRRVVPAPQGSARAPAIPSAQLRARRPTPTLGVSPTDCRLSGAQTKAVSGSRRTRLTPHPPPPRAPSAPAAPQGARARRKEEGDVSGREDSHRAPPAGRPRPPASGRTNGKRKGPQRRDDGRMRGADVTCSTGRAPWRASGRALRPAGRELEHGGGGP